MAHFRNFRTTTNRQLASFLWLIGDQFVRTVETESQKGKEEQWARYSKYITMKMVWEQERNVLEKKSKQKKNEIKS